jgi:hypothetical protein
LFAFHTSAEDAEYLAEELGGGLNKQDLLELGHYQCYARLTDVRTGERLPAFSVRLDPPPLGDSAVADRLAAASAERYGRSVLDVELDLQAAAERVRGSKPTNGADEEYPRQATPSPDSPGTMSSARTPTGGHVPRRTRANGKRKNSKGSDRRGPASDRRSETDPPTSDESAA